jgi:phosphoenolpyruvate---glycerone phosphotransferase subunit DhaK
MKKILNEPHAYVDEMLDGLCTAHPEFYRRIGGTGRAVARASGPRKGKVGVVSGGGSGHLPVFAGYVGPGLLDACAIGDVFSSPGSEQMVESITAADGGAGVLLLFGNYGGDSMNFEMAAEIVEMDGIKTRTVKVADDVASAGPGERDKRRGVAGLVYAYKLVGAKAEENASLDEVTRIAQKAADAVRSIGVALTPCAVPSAGRATFEIGPNEMEFGMGIHGEPGVYRSELKTADAIADETLSTLLADMPVRSGDRVSVLVNSLGATPLEELYIVYRHVAKQLESQGVTIVMPLVGRYATSMEMSGMSLTLCKLDRELEALLQSPCRCAFWSV